MSARSFESLYLVSLAAGDVGQLGRDGSTRRARWLTREGAIGILAALIWSAGVEALLTLIDVLAGVVQEDETTRTARRKAVVAAHRVAAELARRAGRLQQLTLVDI